MVVLAQWIEWATFGAHLALVVAALVLRWRERRRARGAVQAFDPAAQLVVGARYASGVVELAEGESLAVRVEIDEHGTEKKVAGKVHHTYAEVERRIDAKPFYLRRPSGERVRVEPGDKVVLVDKLDTMIWPKRAFRTQVAELTAGEHAICEGVLARDVDPERGRDYRGGHKGWIMRPSPGEDLHISTEGLADRHLLMAHYYGRVALVTLGTLAVAVGFHLLLLWTLRLHTPILIAETLIVPLVLYAVRPKPWYESKLIEEAEGPLPLPPEAEPREFEGARDQALPDEHPRNARVAEWVREHPEREALPRATSRR